MLLTVIFSQLLNAKSVIARSLVITVLKKYCWVHAAVYMQVISQYLLQYAVFLAYRTFLVHHVAIADSAAVRCDVSATVVVCRFLRPCLCLSVCLCLFVCNVYRSRYRSVTRWYHVYTYDSDVHPLGLSALGSSLVYLIIIIRCCRTTFTVMANCF